MSGSWLNATTLALLAALGATEQPRVVRPDLEVVLLVDGGDTDPRHYFLLKVTFSGDVEGGGDLNPGLPPPPKRLSAAAHAELAAILRRERFFSLPHMVGACPPDLGCRSVEAWQGTTLHRVTFCLEREGVRLREAQAVLRTWYGVLSVVGRGKQVQPVGIDKEVLARKP